jgi:hypothetical protein
MPRAATTFLYHTLAHHPDAFVPAKKEIEFFSFNHARGTDWYGKCFASMANGKVGFDISPMYFFAPQVAERIDAFFGDAARVVVMVRDPAEFAVSFYKNRLSTYANFPQFEDFLESFDYTKDGVTLPVHLAAGTMKRSIARFRELLGDRVLVCSYEAISRDPLPVVVAIEEFAGLSPYFTSDNLDRTRVNASDQLGGSRLINRLAHQRWFADLVTAVVPRKLVVALRHRYQTKQRSQPLLDKDTEQRYLEIAAERFAEDRAYVGDLFGAGACVLGGGQPFKSAR